MEHVSTANLYRSDRDAYLQAFWDLDGGYDWDEDELALVNGLALWLGQDRTDGLPEVVGAGYLAGIMEDWRPSLAEHRLSTIWREWMEADIASRFDERWDLEAWPRLIYSIADFEPKLETFAFDADRLNERLGFLCEAAGNAIFDGGFAEENREAWHGFHRYGAALALYLVWLRAMEEQGITDEERWTDQLLAQPNSDPLAELELPVGIHGCTLSREPIIGGYEIRSDGTFGAGHWLRFRALAETAEIVVIVKDGKLGTRKMKVPSPRHVEVLRALGFKQMVWPDGKRYELKTWPGVRRIRD